MNKQKDYLKKIDLPILQGEDFFKVNTDTTALGIFLDEMRGKTVLDIGTNSGALLLYAYTKGAKKLIGIDLFDETLAVAKENLSAYTEDFELYNCPVQDFRHEKVDVIICNPPFFEAGDMRENKYHHAAMYEDSMPIDDMFAAFRRLLKDNGCVYVLYPAERFPLLYDKIREYKLKIMKMQFLGDERKELLSRVLVKLKIGKMSKLKVYRPMMVGKSGDF